MRHEAAPWAASAALHGGLLVVLASWWAPKSIEAPTIAGRREISAIELVVYDSASQQPVEPLAAEVVVLPDRAQVAAHHFRQIQPPATPLELEPPALVVPRTEPRVERPAESPVEYLSEPPLDAHSPPDEHSPADDARLLQLATRPIAEPWADAEPTDAAEAADAREERDESDVPDAPDAPHVTDAPHAPGAQTEQQSAALAATAAAPATLGTDETQPPEPRDNRPPIYPQIARAARQSGTVVLRLNIDIEGSVEQIEVARTSGYPVLDAAAVRAIGQWRFHPARRGGQAVPWSGRLPVEFRLD